MNLGIIGVGNMGYAILKGAIQTFAKNNIYYTDVNEKRLKEIEEETGIHYSDRKKCIQESDIILLAIKPQYYDDFLESIKNIESLKNKIIISIAPGITIEKIKNIVGKNIKIVRVMPNTPALVGEGMSVISFSEDDFSKEEKEFVNQLFSSFGKCIELDENKIDMVVPVSGSSPAYVYMFIEAMADAGVLFGLPREMSYELAAQSVLGAAKMVLETKEHPGVLKDAVCSPGGTTIEAVKKLESLGFRGSIIQAMEDCYNKVKDFS